MEKLNEENKMTFVFSTHDSRVIKRAHRVVTLRDGAIESDVVTEMHMADEQIIESLYFFLLILY